MIFLKLMYIQLFIRTLCMLITKLLNYHKIHQLYYIYIYRILEYDITNYDIFLFKLNSDNFINNN